MAKRATIKSIASDLGISHMTVSRALSGNPNVQPQTREAVERRARELGYVRSAVAGAMRGEDTRIVGLLLPALVNDFYARFANTMGLACDARGHQLIIHLTNDDPALEARAVARLRQVQATAIVMVPTPGAASVGPSSTSDGARTIELIRRRQSNPSAPAVLVDDAPAIGAAVRHLAARGHTHIGYIGGTSELSSGKERLAAFRAGLAAAGLDAARDLIHTGAPGLAFGEQATRALLDGHRATALVCGGFEISNGALTACMNAGIDRSRLDMVGYGDPPHYRWVAGGLSAIKVPVDALAQKAVSLAIDESPPQATTLTCPATFVGR